MAHRGNSGDCPENTLAAFQSGIAAGADWIELDVHRTRDGKLVVSHDRITWRVGSRSLVVPESTYEQLRKVDVAADFRRRHGKSLAQCPPQRMPLMEDVLRLVMAQHQTRASIQPKTNCVAEVVAVVRHLGAEAWVGFNDGNVNYMAEAKRLAPTIPVFWDRGESDIAADIRTAKQHGFETLVLNERAVTPQKVAQLKQAGLGVGVWTVNDPAAWEQFLAMGVERIYTDHPRRLLAHKAGRAFRDAACEGGYRCHLQGICTDGRGVIYWSWTDALVKTDLQGRVLKRLPAVRHYGDLCFHDGKVFVAVNLGEFNKPTGSADSWVYVFDGDSLTELARHPVREVVHGAGGIAYRDSRFIVVGGLPPSVDRNYLYEYDERFRFRKRHVFDSGYTLMGIQTAAWANGSWWFGCYGNPRMLLRANTAFRLTGKWDFDASMGIVGLPDGRFLIGQSTPIKGVGHKGRVFIAREDNEKGMTPVLPRVSESAALAGAGPRPVIIAHRGASGYLPEHTLEAKAGAHAMGADYLEQDVVLSKDGVPVVLHDVQIDTVTDVARRFPGRKRKNGRYYAIDFTLAELKQLRVTERFNPKTGQPVFKGRFPLWQSSFQIPTLEEELQFIQGLNKSTGRNVGIYPEIKAPGWHRQQGRDISRIVLQVLDRYGYKTKADNVWVQCFEFDEVKRIRRELGYQGKLLQLFGRYSAREGADGKPEPPTDNSHLQTRQGLEEVAKVADGIGPALSHVVTGRTNGVLQITDVVKNAHALKLVVHPYTLRVDELPKYVSSFEELCRIFFVEAGVDGAFTDFPDRTSAWKRSSSENNPTVIQ
ncbi:MAG: glycerophosphodiester phosphodiesterase [Verrucomicrobiia bacterium]